MNILNGATNPTEPLAASKAATLDPEKALRLRQSAKDFEAAFLAEALGHMGFDSSNGVGGATEFSSILNRAYAERLVDKGGLGLSENIFRALAARIDET